MINIDIKKLLHGVGKDMQLEAKFSIQDGEFVALSGKSGSGKTTLLRVLAGLEDARGSIEVANRVWLSDDAILPPQKREIGFVFQDYALFENMSIEQNLLFVREDKELAKYLLHTTELYELKDRFPSMLSGGQKQRVSLCRAMMSKPKILLLDEPLSALDPVMRLKLQNEILTLHKEFHTTTLMVSHDPSEIYRLASRVIVLNDGKVVDDATPKDALMKISGSQKFSFEGELLDIVKVDVIYIAIISIGVQIVEIVVSYDDIKDLKIGQKVSVSTKAFSPSIKGKD